MHAGFGGTARTIASIAGWGQRRGPTVGRTVIRRSEGLAEGKARRRWACETGWFASASTNEQRVLRELLLGLKPALVWIDYWRAQSFDDKLRYVHPWSQQQVERAVVDEF